MADATLRATRPKPALFRFTTASMVADRNRARAAGNPADPLVLSRLKHPGSDNEGGKDDIMIKGENSKIVPEETRSGSRREALTEIFVALDKAGVPEGFLRPSERAQEPSQERPDLFSDANAKGIPLGAASSGLLRRVEQSPEPPASMLRTNPLGLTVKAKTSEGVTPEMVKELSEDDLD